MNTMEYKGYHTLVEYSAGDDCLVGEVIGINDLIVFCGESVDEFEHAFHESVDSYLDMCERRGKAPNKTYSGQFNLRVTPELHRELAIAAEKRGDSLNAIVVEACTRFLTAS